MIFAEVLKVDAGYFVLALVAALCFLILWLDERRSNGRERAIVTQVVGREANLLQALAACLSWAQAARKFQTTHVNATRKVAEICERAIDGKPIDNE